MTRFFSMSIRAHLLLIALVVALPAAGIIIYSGIKLRNEVITEAHKDTQKLVDEIVTDQQSLVTGAEQLMTAVAQLPEVKHHDTAGVEPILRELAKLNPLYMNIIVADRDGTVWASAVPVKPPFNIADRRYFKNALARGQLSSGEYIISRATLKPALNFAYPYKDDHGDIAGIIGVGFFTDKYRQFLERMQSRAGTSFVLIDHRGIILSRGIDPEPFIGKEYPPEAFRRMREGPETGTSVRKGLTGDKRIISYRKIRLKGEQTPYMYVTAGVPVEVALKKANKTLFFNVAAFASFLMGALFLAWLIGKRSIVDRVALLEQASRRLATGNLDVRVSDLVVDGELGRLGQTFDTMAEQLALREKALRENEKFLTTIIETEPECVKLIASDGSILMMNRTGLDMLQVETFDQVKGKSLFPFIDPEYLDAFQAMIQDVFNDKHVRLEYKIVGAKGRPLWLETHAVPLRNDTGEIVSQLGITLNITERKRMEAKVNRLNADLTARAGELEEANRELESFNYTVAHDLRKPLTVVNGYVQVLMGTCSDKLDEQCKAYLKEAYEGTWHMNRLIDALLDFSRLAHAEPKRERVDLCSICEEVASELKLAEPERHVTFRIPGGIVAEADPDLLRVVLGNVFGNAWKYTSTREEAVIEFGATEIDGELAYFVRDNGLGFDPAKAESLFAPFQRLESGKEIGGLGIGLATVDRIIKRHGGKVWAEGEPGKGATFFFTLGQR